MPRIRTIKPEFFTSPDTAKVSFPGRIFYQALWCWADDFGIGETNLNGLLGFAFCDDDGFSAQDVRNFCAEVAQHFQVTFYEVRGRYYYAIPSWEEHQKTEKRTARRKHPTPDDPDATPDLRIQACADIAQDVRGKVGADSRNFCAGTGEQGNRGTGEQEDPPTPQAVDLAPATTNRKSGGALSRRDARIAEMNGTARSEAANQVARAYAGWLDAPLDRITHIEVAQLVDELLEDGIDPQQIADGIKAWHRSDSWSPTQIRRFVTKSAQAPSDAGGKPTRKAKSHQDAADLLIAEMKANAS